MGLFSKLIGNDALEAKIDQLKELMTMNHAEEIAALTQINTDMLGVAAQFSKGFNEVEKQVADLQALIAAGQDTVPQEVVDKITEIQANMAALKPIAQQLDDMNADQPT